MESVVGGAEGDCALTEAVLGGAEEAARAVSTDRRLGRDIRARRIPRTGRPGRLSERVVGEAAATAFRRR